ncbi:MAG: hypothetical protein JWL82_146, partial [Parcubacteria group bacterium]|nr:hypothetical protein [Parcubacteria group bacterium]
LVIAYAGATFMLSPTNPESRTKARSMLINVAVGLVILLAAWLVVDFIMKTLYNPNTTSEGVKYGPWNEILAPTSADSWCIKQTSSTPIPGVAGGILGGVLGSPAGNGSASTATKKGSAVGVTKGLCSDGNTACSVAAIKALGLNDAQAQTMSCIAVTESGGNPQTPDSKSGACGTFQITNRPGNWSNPAFHQPPCSTSSSCNSATCNLQTAVIMFKKQGYQPWTGKNPDGTYWNANAVACKMKYNPGS